MAMREYMACLDAGDRDGALAQMDEGLAFLLGLPNGQVSGSSRADYAKYIAGRAAPPDRVHDLVRYTRDRDVELAYGVVREGGRATGAFMSAARLSPDGLILRYQSFFDPTFSLVDLEGS